MKAIVVDDEISMLETLEEAVTASSDIQKAVPFSSCSAALEYAKENPIDIAFLDIDMRGMGGLALAEKLMALQPRCRIVFCTGYEEHALPAIRLHVSGYLIKPITAEAIQKEIDHIKGVKSEEKLLTVQCFGNFEVLRDGEALPFRRTKAKELLAVLVDRNGAGMTAKQICAVLFPEDTDDEKNAVYFRQLIADLRSALRAVGAAEVLQHDTLYYRVDTTRIQCDYLRFLEHGSPKFHGEYMTQYSWAESTCAILQFGQ